MGRKYRAVIVDDEKIILEGLIHTYDWEAAGYEVAGSALDGESALELIKKLRPDVVMTDIRMKKMDGLTLMREAEKVDPTIQFVVISAYRDFEYAQQACGLGAFTYLLKPFNNEEFEKTMGELRVYLEKLEGDRYMRRLFLLHKKEVIAQQIKNYLLWGQDEGLFADQLLRLEADIGPETEYCCVCVDFSVADSGDRGFLGQRYLCFTLFFEELGQRFCVYRVDLSDGRAVAVLWGGEGHPLTKTAVYQGLGEIAQSFEEEGDACFACYGEIFKGFCGMKESFRQCIYGIELTYEQDAQRVLAYKGRRPSGMEIYLYPRAAEQSLLAALRDADKPRLSSAVGEFDGVLEHIGADRAFRLSCYHELCLSVQFFLLSMYGANEETGQIAQALLRQLEHTANQELPAVTGQALARMLDKTAETFERETPGGGSAYVERAVAYIEERLCDCELSIVEVAEQLHLNALYFGRMFKKSTGKSFKEFLSMKRIEKAKMLLETTDLSITDVCYAAGVGNSSYFTTQFKKYTGMLPSEYRHR